MKSKKKKREKYETRKNHQFDRSDIVIYEEVQEMPPFQRKTIVLLGAQGVGRRTLKNRLIEHDPARFGAPVARKSSLTSKWTDVCKISIIHCVHKLRSNNDHAQGNPLILHLQLDLVYPNIYTVEPRYNEVLGTMKITLLYQVSHYIRVKKLRNKKNWDQQNYLVIRGFCYIRPLYNEVSLYYPAAMVP